MLSHTHTTHNPTDQISVRQAQSMSLFCVCLSATLCTSPCPTPNISASQSRGHSGTRLNATFFFLAAQLAFLCSLSLPGRIAVRIGYVARSCSDFAFFVEAVTAVESRFLRAELDAATAAGGAPLPLPPPGLKVGADGFNPPAPGTGVSSHPAVPRGVDDPLLLPSSSSSPSSLSSLLHSHLASCYPASPLRLLILFPICRGRCCVPITLSITIRPLHLPPLPFTHFEPNQLPQLR